MQLRSILHDCLGVQVTQLNALLNSVNTLYCCSILGNLYVVSFYICPYLAYMNKNKLSTKFRLQSKSVFDITKFSVHVVVGPVRCNW